MSHLIKVPPPNGKISCLLSHEKISCLKRKSYVFSVLGPTPMRKSPVSCLMRKSHVWRENLLSHQFWISPNQKISCLLSHEKISCLKRKSYVLLVRGPPIEKISRLLPHEKISCLKRKSHVLSVLGPPQRDNLLSSVSWENLISQEKISCLISFGPPKEKISCLLSQKKISCLMRNSHVSCFLYKFHKKISWDTRFSHKTGDRRFSRWGGPNTEKT